jgi:hypothetical protein
MPDDTTILSLPLILPAQAQKHVTHNEALIALDLIVQLTVINRTLAVPPAAPAVGDRHIVAAGATGAWAGQAGRIALFSETGWQFAQALPGWRAHVLAEAQTAVFDGTAWKTPSESPLTVPQLGVAATADAVNRLTVAAPATLLNHAGAGHQLKLNKAAAGDTASLLFQTGFGGRAEMGTAGTDDFSVKVSANGSAWFTALEAEAATGRVTLPAPLRLGGQAADPASPPNGTLWLNTTSGEVKVRSGGLTLPLGGGGGGVADGDKGDITVSGGGAVWTVDPGAITLGKLASMPTDSFLGRDTAGTGAPEVMTPAQARGILNVADGATANATDAALRDRATHTGTQAAATITGLAAVATSGSASDLGSGTLPAARFSDAAHGSRAGGSLHADATTSVSGFMSGADKTKLNGIATGATANSTDATLLNRANHTGTQGAATISDFAEAVDDRVAALLVAGANISLSYNDAGNALTISATGGGGATNLSYDAATRVIASDTGTDATLPLVTNSAAGLAPASGGGTVNFLRADGTWAAPGGGGGGAPGGASGEIQWNNAGVFAGAADVEIEGGQLRLPAIATPTAPAAGGLKLFGRSVGGRLLPAAIGPSGLDTSLQPHLARNKIAYALPTGNATTVNTLGISISAAGTATSKNWAATNRYTKMRGVEYLVTTASASALSGFRGGAAQFTVGSNAAGDGGFHFVCRWGPATGVATATTRAFVGMNTSTGAGTDVEPSSRTSQCGMGWDAADTNIQFMHNDASGVSTKIDLGPGFPIPTADRAQVYEIAMFSPPGTTQSVSYEITDLVTGAVATGTVSTDLPSPTTGLNPYAAFSVGGTSSVIGICLFSLYVETDY